MYFDRIAICAALIWPSAGNTSRADACLWDPREYGVRPQDADAAWQTLYDLTIEIIRFEKKLGGYHNDNFPLHHGQALWDGRLGPAKKKGLGGVSGKPRKRKATEDIDVSIGHPCGHLWPP
jgi:hypothetical protein